MESHNIHNLVELYKELKVVPLGELTKKILESKLKVASELWHKIDDAFDDRVLQIYEQTIFLIFTQINNLSSQNFIQSAQNFIPDPVLKTVHQDENYHSTRQENF